MKIPNFVGRLVLILALALGAVTLVVVGAKKTTVLARSDPWTSSQVISPEILVKEISSSTKPAVTCVGLKLLFDRGHVPGAAFSGPTQNPDGISDLKHWAESHPKDSPIVLYCGCCPWTDCPNIRPAFAVLKEMGFTNLRVVRIDKDFDKEWVEKGYPVEKQ